MLYDNGQIVEYLATLWSAGVHSTSYSASDQHALFNGSHGNDRPEGYFTPLRMPIASPGHEAQVSTAHASVPDQIQPNGLCEGVLMFGIQ